jgi:hypothetical protein
MEVTREYCGTSANEKKGQTRYFISSADLDTKTKLESIILNQIGVSFLGVVFKKKLIDITHPKEWRHSNDRETQVKIELV